MSWFSPRGSGPRKEQQGRVQTVAEPEVHRSLALAALFEDIRGRKVQVLDLGPALGSNVEFLSQYGCKLYIEDLYAALATRAPSGDGELAGPEFFAEFLAIPEETRFDVIFAWDLFNYLRRKELAHFAAHLSRHCDRGARLFALISILKTMPAQPFRFKIQDEQHLIYERRTSVERPSPRYAPLEITDTFKGFRVDRSFLLRHGIQEFLLVKD